MLTMCVDVLRSRFRPMLALRCLAVVGALFAGLPVANADLVRSISTGLNASENLQMLGGIDANYSLITSADPSAPGPDALVVFTNAFPFPYWVANTSTSQWISPDAHGATEPDGLYVFQMTFDLTGYDASTALISGLWATDNDGFDIKLNGVSTGYTTGNLSYQSLTSAFSISDGSASGILFNSGVNTLQFVVQNGIQSSGNPIGLRVDGTLTARSVPEPASLSMLALGGLASLRTLCRRKAKLS